MSFMTVQIITPAGVVYDHHAHFVLAKTTGGEIGLLPNHMPIIAALSIDEIKVRRTDSDTHVDWVAVNGGVIEMRNNLVTIIADSAERERDIDVTRAERAKIRAERMIEQAQALQNIDELKRAEITLHRAINRINVSKHI